MKPIRFSDLAAESLSVTRRLVEAHGPRLTGSPACAAAADELARFARTFADSVRVETFDVHPSSFLSYTKLLPVAYFLGFLSIYLVGGIYLIPIAGLVAGILLMIFQFGLYLPVGDAFFFRKTGVNVEAVIEPSGEAERELLLSGHHDSAPVARIFSGPFRSLYVVAIFLPYAFFLVELGVLAALQVGAEAAPPSWALPVLVAGLPVALGYFSMVALRRGSPGAGDNLIASVMICRLAGQVAQRRDDLLRSTRLRIVSFDAEEAGLRGSSAYVRRHAAELKGLPCWHLNFDSIYRLGCLQVLTSDINGRQPLSREMVDDVVRCAAARGIRLRRFGMLFGAGATDAAQSARRGIAATTIIALPTEIVRRDLVYHTPEDTVEAIEPGAVEACLRIAAGYLEFLESGGARRN